MVPLNFLLRSFLYLWPGVNNIIIYFLYLKHQQRIWYWRFAPRKTSSLCVEIGESGLLFSPSRNQKNEYIYAVETYCRSIRNRVKTIDRIIEIDTGLFFVPRRPYCVLNGPILFVEKARIGSERYAVLVLMLKTHFKEKYKNFTKGEADD